MSQHYFFCILFFRVQFLKKLAFNYVIRCSIVLLTRQVFCFLLVSALPCLKIFQELAILIEENMFYSGLDGKSVLKKINFSTANSLFCYNFAAGGFTKIKFWRYSHRFDFYLSGRRLVHSN